MTKLDKSKVVDFGFEQARSPYHFAVRTHGSEGNVRVEERFAWPEDSGEIRAPLLKAVLDSYRWSRIADPTRSEFNRRLHAEEMPTGRWRANGDTLLAPHLGKELTLLVWAVEDGDPTLLPNMIANWLGLAPEERWWLYTTINATSGHPEYGRDRGWRKAIKIAFGENPADAPPSTLVELGHTGVRLPLLTEFPYERETPDAAKEPHRESTSLPTPNIRPAKRRTRAQMPLLPEDRG